MVNAVLSTDEVVKAMRKRAGIAVDGLRYSNRSKRRADRLVIGRDHGGNCIVVPVEPTRTPGVWRPVTAWRCSEGYETRLKKEGI